MPKDKGKSPKAKEPPVVVDATPEQIDALANSVLASEFTIAEDLLFMRAQQGHGLAIKDLPKRYSEKKKQQPKTYLHDCKPEVFRERLLQLPEEKQRTKLLDMELNRQIAIEAEAKADVVEVIAATVPTMLLQLSSVNDPPGRAHKRNLEQGCEEVALLVQRHLERSKDGTPLLVIDNTNQKYKDLNDYSCLDSATVSKLAAFSISPKCVLDSVELQAHVQNSLNTIAALADAVVEKLDNMREAKMEEIHERREHEARAMKRQLEEDFEREIAKARAKMNENIEVKSKELVAKWDKVMGAVETHFAIETQEVNRIRDSVVEHSLDEKKERLGALKKAADEIFTPAATMKLALLSKVWGYDALYESCKARIIADPVPHCSSPVWKSPVLDNGLTKEVLVTLPAHTVIAIDALQPPASHVPKDTTARELLLRRKVALAEWSNMDNAQLRELLEKGQILFQEEFAKVVDDRRSGATVDKAVIDTSIASPGILIDDRRLTAACRVARKPLLVHCSPFLQFGGFGRYYFQVVIDSIDAEFGGNIAVGIDVQKSEEAVLEALVPGFVGNDKGVFGCSMQNDGIIYRQGACEMCPATFKQGDVVGVAVDVQLGCLSFYVNNVPVVRDSEADVAAKKGKGKFASAYAIFTPGTTRFRPAVFVYSPRASKLSQVTFDFTMLAGVPVPLHDPISRYA